MKLTLEEAPEFEVIPDGEILAAEVVDCGEREAPWDDPDKPGQKKVQISFKFRITEDGQWYGQHLFGNTNVTFSTHSSCKLRAWVQELLNEDDLPVGFTVDTDALVGLSCRIAVAVREGKTGKRNYVADVIRANPTPMAHDIF